MTTPGENCERHERELERLRDQIGGQAEEYAQRTQRIVALERDLDALGKRVPEDLARWMGETSQTLKSLVRGQEDVVQALQKGYVTVSELDSVRDRLAGFVSKQELENLRTEIRPIVATFWKTAAVIGTTFLVAALGIFFELRSKFPGPVPKP